MSAQTFCLWTESHVRASQNPKQLEYYCLWVISYAKQMLALSESHDQNFHIEHSKFGPNLIYCTILLSWVTIHGIESRDIWGPVSEHQLVSINISSSRFFMKVTHTIEKLITKKCHSLRHAARAERCSGCSLGKLRAMKIAFEAYRGCVQMSLSDMRDGGVVS